jgi:hypothetical protein
MSQQRTSAEGEAMIEELKLTLTIDEALAFADEWSRGLTVHAGAMGWRVVCMLLAEEVRKLRQAHDIAVTLGAIYANRADENGGKTGYPPGMLQDDSRALSRAFASTPDAKLHAREAAAAIAKDRDSRLREAMQRMDGNGHLPGMIAAFETHFGQAWTDPSCRSEASVWASSWRAAKAEPE